MKILITGAEGFVGKNLVQDLSGNGEVLLFPTREALDLTNELMVREFLSANDVDVIVHSATTLRNDTSYPPDTCENNLRMFFNLQKYKKPNTKLMNIGSGSEYSRSQWRCKMKEDYFDKSIPNDSHSYAKYLISKYIDEKQDPTLVTLRLFGIYGKYEDYKFKFISNAIVKNILGLPIVINQNVVYDYLYVQDLSRIIQCLIKTQFTHFSYNVTPTKSIDLVSIAKLINEIGACESEIQILNSGVGIEYSGDNSRLLSEIGDFDFTTEKKAIDELMQYYLSIKGDLDTESIKIDSYLNYAKDLKEKYFRKSDA
jgi:UDP-glucose 4-epimerase